jgi:hypothetical protein
MLRCSFDQLGKVLSRRETNMQFEKAVTKKGHLELRVLRG